jgi:hypothetical protein
LAGEPGLEPRLTESECSSERCFYSVSRLHVAVMLRINIPEMFISTSNGEKRSLCGRHFRAFIGAWKQVSVGIKRHLNRAVPHARLNRLGGQF